MANTRAPSAITDVISRGAYQSFSGAMMQAVLGYRTVGPLQALSYSVTREKAPVFIWGSPNPRGICRGKRGFAGTMVMVMLDRHALLYAMRDLKFVSSVSEIHPDFLSDANTAQGEKAVSDELYQALSPVSGVASSIDTDSLIFSGSNQIQKDHQAAYPWLVDQIPAFDISVVAVNEAGGAARLVIYGAEILNEGAGFSIDDLSVEQQFTYVALNMLPWTQMSNAYTGSLTTES